MGRETFIIAQKKIDNLIKWGPEIKFYELEQVRETLDSPDAIFEGLKREDLSDSHCFSKVPATRKLKPGIEVPFPPELVFTCVCEPRSPRMRHPGLGKTEI